ncbi:MAG: hypothetical protein AABM33_17650 [Pseudomonadota bacterium]
MKSPRTTFTAPYAEWLATRWSMLTGRPPAAPAQDLTPKAAQVVAVQEWEDEGGSIKPAKKPGPEPAPKIPF